AVRRTDFPNKRKAWHGTNRAIGLALFYHGAGFTGAGEKNLKSRARLELTPTGVRIAVGSTEIGQGTRTMHAQIVSDALGIPYENIEVAQPDTSVVADSGPTVAARTCMVVGKILEECAIEMRERIGALSPEEYFARHGARSDRGRDCARTGVCAARTRGDAQRGDGERAAHELYDPDDTRHTRD